MPPISFPDPPLTDARVALRPWEDGDVAWLAQESRDPLVPRFTTVPGENTDAHVRAALLAHPALRERGEQVHLLGVETTGGTRVGPVGLHRVDWRERSAEIGYWTARAARGRGLTSAAVRLVCAWGFEVLGLERIELRADVENLDSLHLAQRCGFVREGVARDAVLRQGNRRSLVVLGLLAGELRTPLT